MQRQPDIRRIVVYLALAFGVAWVFGLIIFLNGGLVNSPRLIPGTPITLALVLLATGYMSAPALAHILTRLITGEGWSNTLLRPRLRQSWPYWLAGWVLPAVLTVLGALFFFALFPRYFDPSLTSVKTSLERSGQASRLSAGALVAIQLGAAVLVAPLVNGLFTFGEEFGWRAYLLPKLLPLGERRALVILGVIWGVWHWPVIAMGHNYGLVYPWAPWSGMLAMVWFTLVAGTFLGWLTLRSRSVWPAVIGHAAINAIAGVALLFVQGRPDPLLGPAPMGLIASAAWTLVAAWILLRPRLPVAPRAESELPT